MNRIFLVLISILSVTMFSCKRAPQNRAVSNEYKLMEITLTNKTMSTNYPATIRGRQDVEIRPQVSGLITEINVTEGQTVRKGQTLFVIDQVAYRAALETASASVEVAKSSVATAKLTTDSKRELFNQNVISSFDLQTAENALKTQEAILSQAIAQETNARNNLSYTVVKSPADGVVGTLPYRVGALVNPSIATPLTTVSDNADMYVYFSMTENQALTLVNQYGSLNKAIESMPALELRLNNKSVYAQKGRVESISGLLDQRTGTVSVRAIFPNKERILLSGGSGNIVFPYQMDRCIVIPQAATFEIQDKHYAYKVVDGVAQSVQVELFPVSDGKEYIAESGLAVGDVIVAEGAGLLRNGTAVQPKKN